MKLFFNCVRRMIDCDVCRIQTIEISLSRPLVLRIIGNVLNNYFEQMGKASYANELLLAFIVMGFVMFQSINIKNRIRNFNRELNCEVKYLNQKNSENFTLNSKFIPGILLNEIFTFIHGKY